MKQCFRCKVESPASNFYYEERICKDCKRKANRERQLKQMYGITEADYNEMYANQQGKCAICETTQNNNPRMKYFCVDHCHTTGRVRGLLCQECNFFLGKLEKYLPTLDKFTDYLNQQNGPHNS